jgi:hypothetical protein
MRDANIAVVQNLSVERDCAKAVMAKEKRAMLLEGETSPAFRLKVTARPKSRERFRA